jgi:predicted esterase/photosystem II stability/assembly factor-like uncharacterized protein
MPGDFHSQPLMSGGETRHYFLHVPSDYACATAWPLLVDFHGTGFGSLTDPVEESWAFDEMIEASNTEHFIVVRPRSRSKAYDGQYVYQWDINPGDLQLNHDFALALVADLESRYHIDPSRIYALGFSNGPTMATQFLADDPSIMHGYAAISGGLNAPLPKGPDLSGMSAPRVYEMTGFRDYMQVAQRALNDDLLTQGLPPDHVFAREADTGHELYGWHYHEAFRWMDKGVRPKDGALATAWTRDTSFTGTASLIQLARSPSGDLYASGTEGAIYRKQAAGAAWTLVGGLDQGGVPLPMADICFDAAGHGYASGDGWLATSADGSSWATSPRLPEFGAMQFGYTHVNSVGCDAAHVVAAGVWSAAASNDGGGQWNGLTFDMSTPFFTQMRKLPSGTWLGIGYYDSLVRSTDGVSFTTINPPKDLQWLNGLTGSPGGKVWVVGEKGAIFASSDDAQSFSVQQAPGVEDLYAVAFTQDGLRGLAVGSHGAAYATTDGGAHWTDKSTGLDAFLGDVMFLDDHQAIVVGERGTVLTIAL